MKIEQVRQMRCPRAVETAILDCDHLITSRECIDARSTHAARRAASDDDQCLNPVDAQICIERCPVECTGPGLGADPFAFARPHLINEAVALADIASALGRAAMRLLCRHIATGVDNRSAFGAEGVEELVNLRDRSPCGFAAARWEFLDRFANWKRARAGKIYA